MIGLGLAVALRGGGGPGPGSWHWPRVAVGGLAPRGPSPCDRRAPTTASPSTRRSRRPGRPHAGPRSAAPRPRRPRRPDRPRVRLRPAVSPTPPGPTSTRSGRPVDVLHVGGGGFTFPRYLAGDAAGSAPDRPRARSARARGRPRASSGSRRPTPSRSRVGDARRSIERLPDRQRRPRGRRRLRWPGRPVAPDDDRVPRRGRARPAARRDVRHEPHRLPAARVRARRGGHRATVCSSTWPSSPAGRRCAGESGGNVVLVASEEPLDVAAVTARIDSWGSARDRDPRRPPRTSRVRRRGAVLTDDFAPVDQLLGR